MADMSVPGSYPAPGQSPGRGRKRLGHGRRYVSVYHYATCLLCHLLLPTLHVLHLWLGEEVVEDDNLGMVTDGLLSGQN